MSRYILSAVAKQDLKDIKNYMSRFSYLEAHWAEGGHIWGLFWLRPRIPIGQLAQELLLVWETTEAEEWIDRLEWIPF